MGYKKGNIKNMLALAHTGLTAGGAWLVSRSIPVLGKRIDFRLLLLGSMLPDIIDKPLGIYLLSEQIGNGRIYGHTLLFLILLLITGVILYAKHDQASLMVVAAGVLCHILLDQMWQNPQTLFWPLLGIHFERYESAEWLSGIIENLTTRPDVYIPEIIGAALLIYLLFYLVRRRRLQGFIRNGHIE